MSEPTPLERLALAAGIQPTYRDAWGEERRVGDATRMALLRSMHIDVDGSGAIAASLHRMHAASWLRPLEPVTILRRGEGIAIALTLPDRIAGAEIRWRVEGAGGTLREGRCRADELRVVAESVLDGRRFERRRLQLPILPPGEYRLAITAADVAGEQSIIVVPARCFLPPDPATGRHWALAAQLYGLRRVGDWGHGDYTGLSGLLALAGRLGAAGVGINPIHAMFPERPGHRSPYSPSDRRFLAQLYIDIEAVPEFADCAVARDHVASPAFRDALAHARAALMVDYEAVAALKLPVLAMLFRCFRERGQADPTSDRAAAFRGFCVDGGEALQRLATFQALSAHHAGMPWPDWPEALHDPEGPEVAALAADEAAIVEFFVWLQWEGERQLGAATAIARKYGMAIGLYRDLAVGPAGDGAETWSNRALLAKGVSVGAPPDAWNALGQDWGLPPYLPEALRAESYRSFREIVRANMRHAGALRIDHAMGLERMFWIPAGAGPAEGAYVHYPVDDLFGLVALESMRAQCLVIGEDLGTLPPGFTDRMRDWGMLSYRLLYFERDGDGAVPATHDWPRDAAVAVTTHDLATLPGYWSARDVYTRAGLGLYPDDASMAEALAGRERDKTALLEALRHGGFLPADCRKLAGPLDPDTAIAVYRFLARTPARLLLVNLEDLFGDLDQHNMPGTIDEYPNWRRRSVRTLEALAADPLLARLAAAIAAEGDLAARRGR